MVDPAISLLIAGAYIKSEAYPNVLYRIGALIDHSSISATEIKCRLLTDDSMAPERNVVKRRYIRLLLCNVPAFFRVLLRRKIDCLYIPYPSIFLQFFLSLLPPALKPRKVIIDAFISLYDTMVIDRGILGKNSLAAKVLFAVERRAFITSDFVAVDTSFNADYYSELFGIPSSRFVPVPLATNETAFRPTPYISDNQQACRILFIGTLIPLHGIRTIISAMNMLEEHKNISFHIIGDGQEAAYLEYYSSGNPDNFVWDRRWYSAEELNSAIADSDICLGIFGTTCKAQRVCPYKIYHYTRVGRPVITARTKWTDSIISDENRMPFSLVNPGDPEQLANRILALVNDADRRLAMAEQSHVFYLAHLSVAESTKKLVTLMEDR